MSDPRTEHPDSERLLAFAEGRLSDCAIEKHLDECEICAEAVLIAREVACLSDPDLIPPLSSIEKQVEKDRLRAILKRQPLIKSPKAPPGGTALASLGALGGMAGLGQMATGPKPMLAGTELHPTGHDHDSPDNPANSEESGVIPHHDPVSHEQTPGTSDELAQFLERVEEALGAETHTGESSPPQDSEQGSSTDVTTDQTSIGSPPEGSSWHDTHSHFSDHATDDIHTHDDHHDFSDPHHEHDEPQHDSHHDDGSHHDG